MRRAKPGGCSAARQRGPPCHFSAWLPCRGRFRKRNLKHAKECSIQQRRGFACGVCRWKRRFGCSRNSAVSAARFESGFRERDGQGQHWRGPHSHGGFLKMIVCESGGHANGLTYFIFRFLRRPQKPTSCRSTGLVFRKLAAWQRCESRSMSAIRSGCCAASLSESTSKGDTVFYPRTSVFQPELPRLSVFYPKTGLACG